MPSRLPRPQPVGHRPQRRTLSENDWTESGLIWNNAPAIVGSALSVTAAGTLGTCVKLDLGSTITGIGTYSFALSKDGSSLAAYSSGEGSNPPQLVVAQEP